MTDLLRSVAEEVSPEPPPADEPSAILLLEVLALPPLALAFAVPAYRRVLKDVGCKIQDAGCRVQGAGRRVQGSGTAHRTKVDGVSATHRCNAAHVGEPAQAITTGADKTDATESTRLDDTTAHVCHSHVDVVMWC